MGTKLHHLKVLLVEHSASDAQRIRQLLTPARRPVADRLELFHAVTPANAVALARQITFDVILVGLDSVEAGALDGIAGLATAVSPALPLILLTNTDDAALLPLALQRGAYDCLPKSELTPWLLRHTIQRATTRPFPTPATTNNDANTIAAQNPDGILVLTKDQIIQFANPAAAELLQKSPTELLGSLFSLPANAASTSELTLPVSAGQEQTIELRLANIEWDHQPAIQISLRDVTHQKNSKSKLSRRAKMLELQNYELDQFNSTMAHQIQGLLGQIIGYASLIDMQHGQQMSPDARMMMERILHSGHKMNNIINELLLLSSMRRGEVDIIPIDMERVLIEVFKRLRFEIDEYNGRIHQPNDWPTALGQPSWVEEVWVNYITNGLKYGGSPPRIELGATAQPNGMIRFWVKDNGAGISPTDQNKLFKPHTRLQQPKVRGEGLGLSIVRRIVEKCGGEVGVTSEEGAGSTFWFTLQSEEAILEHSQTPSADTLGEP